MIRSGPARDVVHGERGPLQRLDDKVAVRHAEKGVSDDAVEAELGCQKLAVDLKGVSGERTAAERALVDALVQLAQALEVAGKGEGVGHDPVRPADGLCALQMGVSGHEHVHVELGAADVGAQEVLKDDLNVVKLAAKPEAHVGGHLIVARAAGVQLAGNAGADNLAEAALVGSVDVLVDTGDNLEGVGVPLGLDQVQAADKLVALVLGQDAAQLKGLSVGLGALDVGGVHVAVIVDRLVVDSHERIGGAWGESALRLTCWTSIRRTGEAAAPELCGGHFCGRFVGLSWLRL